MTENNYLKDEKISSETDIKLNQPMYLSELFGMFQTVSVAPTAAPARLINQIQIYTNGATYRLYWWDNTNNVWHYVTATA